MQERRVKSKKEIGRECEGERKREGKGYLDGEKSKKTDRKGKQARSKEQGRGRDKGERLWLDIIVVENGPDKVGETDNFFIAINLPENTSN